MAVLFLVLALLAAVVIGAAGFENTTASSATLLDRSFSQLTEGQLLVLFAGLGFLVAVFLFLAFGASRTRRSRRKELKSRRRDAEGRVGELERENDRLRQELTSNREELESVERGRTDAVAERDRAEATADSIRSDAATDRDRVATETAAHDRTGATAVDDPAQTDRSQAADPAVAAPPEPTSARRERLDDRTDTPVRDEHARAAEEHAQAADEHAQAADDQAGRR
jgi:membrane protein implicated in regulation of membrane protease activity